MERKAWNMVGIVLFAVLILVGCETLKGAGKDAENTIHNAGKVAGALANADSKFREQLW